MGGQRTGLNKEFGELCQERPQEPRQVQALDLIY